METGAVMVEIPLWPTNGFMITTSQTKLVQCIEQEDGTTEWTVLQLLIVNNAIQMVNHVSSQTGITLTQYQNMEI